MSQKSRIASWSLSALLAGGAVLYWTTYSQMHSEPQTRRTPSADHGQQETLQAKHSSASFLHTSAPDSYANKEVKVRRLSGRTYLVEDFGQIPDGPAKEVIAELKPIALAGDATASYAIFLKLNECADIGRRASKGHDPRASADAVAACLALPAKDQVSSGEWLSLAAEQGNIGARLLYAMDSELALGGPAELLRNPDRTMQYKQKSIRYLEEMASQGSVDALLQLANAYHTGVLVSEDLIASRAYFEAVRRAAPSVVPVQQVSNLERTLSAKQLSIALVKGTQIHESCCQ